MTVEKQINQIRLLENWTEVEINFKVSSFGSRKRVGTKITVWLLSGTGKVARRIAPLLSSDGYNVLLASRSGHPSRYPISKG